MAGATNRDLKLTCQIGHLTMHAIHFICNRTNLQDCLQKRHPRYAPLPRPLLVGEVECKLRSVQMIINIVLGEGVNFYILEGNLMSGLILSRFSK